ncbi:GGDEF domain-containing protein [Phaeospirillum tilakii]|uniref:diguanylate cyclase n=1 Tax=Phaeospirillum tilakii TaxID=741673 RepID=A0ABW5C4H9_9PROT
MVQGARQGLRAALAALTAPPWPGLLAPWALSAAVQTRRARLAIGRVRLVAGLFAALTLLWIPLDLAIFKPALAFDLAALRVLASLAFATLALSFRRADGPMPALLALTWLLGIPTLFFLVSHPLLAGFPLPGAGAQVVATGYAFLPFVMQAGLALFPITALEGILLSLMPLTAFVLTGLVSDQLLPFASHLGAEWLLLLLAVVATLAGMSQLHLLALRIDQGAIDPVTEAFSRQAGERLLTQADGTAARLRAPLSLALAEIDELGALIERHGPDEGDAALRALAAALRRQLGPGDLLIRWDETRLLAALPDTPRADLARRIERLRAEGIGPRPDGRPLTATVTLAERGAEAAEDWRAALDRPVLAESAA